MSTAEKIKQTALELFGEAGIEGISMRKIADRVGVSATALYRHYPGKEGIVADLVNDAFKRFYQFEMKSLSSRSAHARLHETGEGYLAFAMSHPKEYELIFMSNWPAILSANCPEGMDMGTGTANFHFLVDRIRDGQAAGILRQSLDPEVAAITVWAHCHGLVSLYLKSILFGMPEVEFKRLYRASLAMLFEGLNQPTG